MVYLCVYTSQHSNGGGGGGGGGGDFLIKLKIYFKNNTRASFIDFVFKRLVYNCVYIVVGV